MWLRNWRRRRLLRRNLLDRATVEQALHPLPLLSGLDEAEILRLRGLTTLFLHEKLFEGARGIRVEPEMALTIALQACLPVLNLGFDWLDGWVSVVLYPDTFVVDHEEVDAAGVIHRVREARGGESWQRGPLILSWADVDAGRARDGYNVVVHEIAHKLDALNGAVDGFPPLHRDMPPPAWTAAFEGAWQDLGERIAAGQETAIDRYAAEGPEEFFAVASEAFFETPHLLRESYPAVYGQLQRFYRQDPATRLTP